MKPIEFDVKLTDKDMYRFNMYHAYTGFQGIFATVIGIAVFVVAIMTAGKVERTYTLLYLGFGIVFLIYMPVSLLMRSKRQMLTSEVLKDTLHFKLDDAGVHVSQKGQTGDLPWNQIYKMVSTKSNLLIYSSRINAYVVPKHFIEEQYGEISKLASEKLESFQIKL